MKQKTKAAAAAVDEELELSVDAAESIPAANGDEDSEMDEGQVVDLITGAPVKLSPKESIRQEEERKLLEEFGYPEQQKKDLIRLDFRVKPQQGKPRRLPLAVLRPAARAQRCIRYRVSPNADL